MASKPLDEPSDSDSNSTMQPSTFNQRQLRSSGQRRTMIKQDQAALALAICKSKPITLSIEEYLLQLNEATASGTRLVSDKPRYIDSALFWKNQCKNLEDEKMVLEAIIYALQAEGTDEAIDAKETFSSAASAKPSLKRKRQIDVNGESAAGHLELRNHYESQNDLSDKIRKHGQPILILTLLEKCQNLNKLIKDNSILPDRLTAAIRRTLDEMKRAFDDLSSYFSLSLRDDDEIGEEAAQSIKKAIKTISVVWSTCLKALSHLCRDINGRQSKGAIIYGLVGFFKRVLQQIQHLCCCATPNDDLFSTRRAAAVKALTKLLSYILTSPDLSATQTSHLEVLEGILSLLLGRIGSLISQATFREHITICKTPGQVSAAAMKDTPITPINNVNFEGTYLATALKNAIWGTDTDRRGSCRDRKNQVLQMLGKGNKNLVAGLSAEVTQDHLSLESAMRRLQSTLIKGIFGDNGKEFMDTLKVFEEDEEEEEAEENTEQAITKCFEESFIESVWSVVGWDMIL